MKDNIKHIIVGLGAALVIALPVWLNTNDLFAGLWACMAGVIVGGVKEWCDMHTDGNAWSWKDFGFTAIGVAIAMVIIIVSHYAEG